MKLDHFPISHPRSISLRRGGVAIRSLSLLEVALITVMLGIALAIAIPGYMRLEQHGRDDGARSRLADATRVLDRHRSTTGTYRGTVLPAGVEVGSVTQTSYCVETKAGDQSWHASGPYGSKPVQGACPAP